jgi:hypothetical protein
MNSIYQVRLDVETWLASNNIENPHEDHSLMIVPRGCVLQFVIDAGSPLLKRNAVLYCNFPELNVKFDRNFFNSYVE